MSNITLFISFMSKQLKELNSLYIHSNETYVEHFKLYSCKDISDSESYSVSGELMSLSLIAINLSLAVAPLNFNFFLGGRLTLGFQCFGVDVLPGVTSFLKSAFIAQEAIIVLIDSRSIESMSNVLSNNKSTIVMSLETSATVLYTSLGFGLCKKRLKVVSHFLLVAQSNLGRSFRSLNGEGLRYG